MGRDRTDLWRFWGGQTPQCGMCALNKSSSQEHLIKILNFFEINGGLASTCFYKTNFYYALSTALHGMNPSSLFPSLSNSAFNEVFVITPNILCAIPKVALLLHLSLPCCELFISLHLPWSLGEASLIRSLYLHLPLILQQLSRNSPVLTELLSLGAKKGLEMCHDGFTVGLQLHCALKRGKRLINE